MRELDPSVNVLKPGVSLESLERIAMGKDLEAARGVQRRAPRSVAPFASLSPPAAAED